MRRDMLIESGSKNSSYQKKSQNKQLHSYTFLLKKKDCFFFRNTSNRKKAEFLVYNFCSREERVLPEKAGRFFSL